MNRATKTLNYLAVAMAGLAVLTMAMNWFVDSPWWVFLVFIPVGYLMAAYAALPFFFMLANLRSDRDEAERIISALMNLGFCIVAGFEVHDLIGGRTPDALEVFCMGFAPLALVNACHLMFNRQRAMGA